MTDEEIGEIYSLARDALLGGQKEIQLQAYPFRMTPANLARHRNNPNLAFWQMIKEGDDHFQVSHLEPKVNVCERRYVFDAVSPDNPAKPLSFNPAGRCPKFEIDPTIAGAVALRQQIDNSKFAQLVRENIAEAPLTTETDGGMNRVFISRLDNATYTYDNSGHIHVPPLQPGRLPPAISPPPGSESDMTAAIAEPPAEPGSVSNIFGNMFASRASAEPAVASADSGSHAGFFSGLFGSKPDAAQEPAPAVSAPVQTATAARTVPKLRPSVRTTPTATASLRPKTLPQAADSSKPKPKTPPVEQANASTPPANGGSLINGAQPVVPSGNFNSRWAGF
jgi:hypothetical protein